MKKLFVLFALVAGLFVAVNASAQTTPSFNYVQVAAQSQSFNSSNPVGFAVAGSKTLGDVLFVAASADRSNFTKGASTTLRAGLGAQLDFTNGVAAYGEAYALHAGVSQTAQLKDLHSYGFGAEAGLRANLFGPLEVRGGVASEKVAAKAGFVTYGLVGAQLNLTKNLAIVGDARYHDAIQHQYDVGVRLNF